MAQLQPFASTVTAHVLASDRNAIVGALTSLLPLASDRWFPRGNGYLADPHSKIVADQNLVPSTRKPNFLRYMAASTFVHCGDAWSYLGRSLDALIRGDITGSVHLLYYAELRAAISLLASEGIFIGKGRHFAVTTSGAIELLSKEGTHTVVWQAIQAWIEGSRALVLLEEVLRPGGTSLSDWTRALTSRAAQAKIEQLFKLMSLDLQSFDTDHNRRNRASYQPSRLQPSSVDATVVQGLISETWRYLEPGLNGAFPALDEALLPEILSSIYQGVRRPANDWPGWIDSIVPAELADTALVAAIKSGGVTESDTLFNSLYTAKISETDPAKYIRPMMARTIVLLRIATGSSILLLRDSGHGADAVSEWTTSLALDRGLWSPGAEPASALDLWADVEVILEEVEAAASGTRSDLLHGLRTGLLTLGQTERVPVWSFT